VQIAKTYADGSVVRHGYDEEGRPSRTTWARGAWFENHYDEWGQTVSVTHDDPTIDAAMSYDDFGRLVASSNNAASYRYAYDDRGLVTNELAVIGGVTNTIVRDFDVYGRLSRLRIADSDYDQTYAYDDAGRLSVIGIPGSTVTYAYTPDSLDAGYSVLTPSNAVLTRALFRDPQRRGLILSVSNLVNGVDSGSSFDYTYDALGRPVTRNLDEFGYNARGEVAWARYGTNTLADIYDYDFIGNFTSNRLRGAWSQFEANELNEYAAITDSNPRALVYDADGNLLTNGVWSYSYDSRNRLSSICSNDVLLATEIYDANSRRVTTESHNETQRHLYDVWNEIRESDSNGNIPSDKDRFWGKDLSGALQGAGGIGGLICESFSGNSYFPACDNLGNIVIYSGANGFIVASYRYDAFGNILFEIGAPTAEFLYRFSSKPFDRGLYYYGYRFFSSDLGRWLARDPEGEIDAKQLFCAFGNNAFSFFDYLGRSLKAIPYQDYPVKTELPYFKLIITWQLDSPATNTGVVIQHMKLSRDICDCSGNKLVDDVREYWEIVGIIKKGKVTTDDTYNKLFNGDDLWEFPKGRTLPNTRGTVTWEGDPVFYPGITNVVGFAVEANSPADHAPISWNQPQGLPEGIQGEHRTDSITWDRCK